MPEETLEVCPNCKQTTGLNSRTAEIRCCLNCGKDVTPLEYFPRAVVEDIVKDYDRLKDIVRRMVC